MRDKTPFPLHPTGNPKEFDKLPEIQRQAVLDWIEKTFTKRKTKNPKATVERIRNLYFKKFPQNRKTNTYITKDEIFGAMLAAGFEYAVQREVKNIVAGYYFNASLPKS